MGRNDSEPALMNVEALTAISRCRSLPEFLAAQTALVRGNIELTLENSQRLTQLSMTVVREATGNDAERADRPRRAA